MSLSYHIYSDPEFVRQYEESIIDNAWNACYERPSTLALLPADIQGLEILDAGCGPGIVSAWLLQKEANVTAVDYSMEMIERTVHRTQGSAKTHVLDLNNGLPGLPSSHFAIVYASLVIHYIQDLHKLFAEFARVLQPGGQLIFSTDHPASVQLNEASFTQREHSVFWDGFNVKIDLYQRSWDMITEALLKSGFKIDIIKDAEPTEICRLKYPEVYNLLLQQPYFICVRANKIS